MTAPSHLIVVCCHGIWLGGASKGTDEAEWLIAPFQRGETATFIAHAHAGLDLHAQDPTGSVVVFSGGPTRKETRLSEAQSYALVAAAHNHWNLMDGRDTDMLLEERALDSYHNILFSLTLFYTRFGTWPASMTLVGHAFKRPRLEAHVAAIGFPLPRVHYLGQDPPAMAEAAAVLPGVAQTHDEWRLDPHGKGPRLAGKRRARNPWAVWQGVFPQDNRDTGGLITRGHGEEETLDPDAPRPW